MLNELTDSTNQLVVPFQLAAPVRTPSTALGTFDRQGRLRFSNESFRAEYRHRFADGADSPTLAQTVGSLSVIQNGSPAAIDIDALLVALESRHDTVCGEWTLADGRIIELTLSRSDGDETLVIQSDVTCLREESVEIAYMAKHDLLTGLFNRAVFTHELEHLLGRREVDAEVAVILVDLDFFTAINDTLGYPVGDALLREVAVRLRECVREQDLVARIGGDEFAVIQIGGHSSTTVGRRIIEALSHPFDLHGHGVHVGASVGIAVAPFDGETANDIVKNADLALSRSKSDGRNTLRYFEPEMDTRSQERRHLELDLRDAIQNSEFELFYQPMMDVATNSIVAFEALIRWNHPVNGRISPGAFMPVAEATGLITQIGEWVLAQACTDAMGWPPEVRLSVNVSPVQLARRGLAHAVMNALNASGLTAKRLDLEITEGVLLESTEQTLSILHQLRDLGVGVSMDDFGTGYSSISYLRRFPFDKIKIDQSFVRDLGQSEDAVAIIRAVISLGRSLGMRTTVEGVETPEQMQFVRSEGCDEIQGYLLSRPQPINELAQLLSAPVDRLIAVTTNDLAHDIRV